MTGDGNKYQIVLESDVPAWAFEYLVKPLDQLAQGSDGAITLTIRQKDGPLG